MSDAHENKPDFPLARKRLMAAAVSACFVSAPAWANPTGPQVVNGSASFSQAGNLLTVNNSNGAIINWNSFSIAAKETTRFNQPSATSSVLNRVIANDPSVLLGTLSSNGKVWLVNPAGILVGQGAKIDVAGFVASTLDVANQDFLAGRLNFQATPNAGSIQNAGQIKTPSGGSVYLVAPSVTNNGIIDAPNGEVILAAGQTVQLVDTSTPGVTVQITGAKGNATNLGKIISEAGQIGIAGVLVNNSGELNASSVVKEGGRVFLKASRQVNAGGSISASGGVGSGGSIKITAPTTVVTADAAIDASGETGGGTILVGGGLHGQDASIANATTSTVAAGAQLNADASRKGDGGTIVVWSNDDTAVHGSFSARGGPLGGTGGLVETSGHVLDVTGTTVDTRAVDGSAGTWLLDPADITIEHASATGSPDYAPSGSTSTIADGDINNSLATTDVSISTSSGSGGSGNITVNGTADTGGAVSISNTSGGARSLTLTADGSIDMHAGATIINNGGTVNFTAGGNITLTGASISTDGVAGVGGADGANGTAGGAGGVGGNGGNITIKSLGGGTIALSSATIEANGGNGGQGGNGGNGYSGYAYSANAGSGGNGGNGGTGGTISLQSAGPIQLSGSSISANGGYGGQGGNGGNGYSAYGTTAGASGGAGGIGGYGGSIALASTGAGGTISLTSFNLDANAGRGGNGGTGGYGGAYLGSGGTNGNGGSGGGGSVGGIVSLQSAGLIELSGSSIRADGGYGGKGGDGAYDNSGYGTAGGSGGAGGIGGNGGSITLASTGTGGTDSYASGGNGAGLYANGGNGGAGGVGGNGKYSFGYSSNGGSGGNGSTGGNGGSVSITSSAGSVTLGSAANSVMQVRAEGGEGGYGGNGGNGSGGYSEGPMTGGTGGNGGVGGDGGTGGSISIASYGTALTIGSSGYVDINASGGKGQRGGYGGYGGNGSYGGNGGTGGNSGGGGSGGYVSLVSNGAGSTLTIGSYASVRADGGTGVDMGAQGGHGGRNTGFSTSGYGGNGGNGGNGGIGGQGGSVSIVNSGSSGILNIGSSADVTANGGYGGYGGDGGYGGYGGSSGGGNGGTGGAGGTGGNGGDGGSVTLSSTGAGGTIGLASSSLLGASGGHGGYGGSGASGGSGGQGDYLGGAGGAGGAGGWGGNSGSGGAITLESTGAGGTISLTSSSLVASAGSGGSGGTGGVGGDGGYASYGYSTGGDGGTGGTGGTGGNGSTGGSIVLNANGAAALSSYSTLLVGGGAGGSGGAYGAGGSGGNAAAPGGTIGAAGADGLPGASGTDGAAGSWLVYSGETNSALLAGERGGLTPDFKQYDAVYGDPVLGTGNGFIYSIAPVLQLAVSFASNPTKTYDGTNTANVAGATVSIVGGTIDGDSATLLNGPTSATYDTKNAGTGKAVTVSGMTGVSADENGVPVYGYLLPASVTATGIGVINQASLTLSAVTDAKTYDGTTNSGGTPTVSGTVYSGDSLTGLIQSFASKNVLGTNGSTLNVNTNYTLSDGNGGNNYSITYVSATGTITPAPLILNAATDTKVYDGSTSSAGAPTVTGLYSGDSVTGLTQSFASPNVLGSNASTLNVNTGYTLNDGNGGGNYTISYASATGTITQRPLSTWIGGTSGNWSVASNWDALPDLSNVAAVSIPAGTTVTYDSAAGSTSLTSLTAGGLNIAGGTLNIANNLTTSSSFSQSGGTLNFGGGASADITQATGNMSLPAIQVANLSLNAPTGAITQSGPLAALTLITQSQGATTLDNPNNQIAGRVDMTAGGPLTLWASGDLNLGAINAGTNAVQIKAGGAILQAPGTLTGTNIIAGSADLASIFGGASGNLAISTNTQVTGALTATVGSGADFGGIRIQNTGAEPTSVTLTDNAPAGASVSFLNTGDITSTSGITLATQAGGDLALLSNGNITWDGGSLATPSGSVLVSTEGSLGVTGALSSPVDLALSSTNSINVSGSVATAGSGTASFTAPTVALNGTVDSADDVGVIATTLNLGAGSSTSAAHDVIFAADNITATNATVSAGNNISAAVTGDMRLNGSSFTAGNDIYVNMLGATSTLYLNDTVGLAPSFLWAQAPSTIHLSYAAEAYGRMVVDGAVVDPFTFVASPGGSGLFYGAAKTPATPGAGLDLVYGIGPGAATTVAPTLIGAVIAAISSSTTSATTPAGTLLPIVYGNGLGSQSGLGEEGQTIGGTEGNFGGGEEEGENKTDQTTGLKKKSNKSITKKLSTCS